MESGGGGGRDDSWCPHEDMALTSAEISTTSPEGWVAIPPPCLRPCFAPERGICHRQGMLQWPILLQNWPLCFWPIPGHQSDPSVWDGVCQSRQMLPSSCAWRLNTPESHKICINIKTQHKPPSLLEKVIENGYFLWRRTCPVKTDTKWFWRKS